MTDSFNYPDPAWPIEISEKELDAKLEESSRVVSFEKSDGWQLILLALRRKASRVHSALAAAQDIEKIRILQAWLQCFGDIQQSMAEFISVNGHCLEEKDRRRRGVKERVVDFWNKRENINGVN